MTTRTPDPLTALSALALAFDIVSTPCSAAETQRAEVLLGIAREIREEQQYRRVAERFDSPPPPATAAGEGATDWPATARDLASGDPERVQQHMPAFVDRSIWDRAVAPAGVEGLAEGVIAAANDAATAYMPAFAERTQNLPVVWSVGDKADCRHCHTPIIFVARRMSDPTMADEGDPRTLWAHKYSDQRVCATASIDSGCTFAEPAARG